MGLLGQQRLCEEQGETEQAEQQGCHDLFWDVRLI